MSIKAEVIRTGIKLLGGIQKEEFITAGGKRANRKIELGVLERNRLLRGIVVGELASRAAVYEPDLIIPIPEGSNDLGRDVAARLDIRSAFLEWIDKTPGRKRIRPKSELAAKRIAQSSNIVFIDDVYTEGSSLTAAYAIPELRQKVAAAEVIWNRGDPSISLATQFPVESIVEEFIPLWQDDE